MDGKVQNVLNLIHFCSDSRSSSHFEIRSEIKFFDGVCGMTLFVKASSLGATLKFFQGYN
jgi:hypothetical protein